MWSTQLWSVVFWYIFRYRVIQYLIRKLSDMAKIIQDGKVVAALSIFIRILWKLGFCYIKGDLLILNLAPLHYLEHSSSELANFKNHLILKVYLGTQKREYFLASERDLQYCWKSKNSISIFPIFVIVRKANKWRIDRWKHSSN